MTMPLKTRKIKLSADLRERIRARRVWRKALIDRSREFATWPAGKPGREDIGLAVSPAVQRVRDLFTHRAALIVSVATRRATK